MSTINLFDPNYVVHPGEYLEEVLDARQIKRNDFARKTGLSTKAVSQIIQGNSLFSPEVALRFEKALDIKAEIWIGLVESFQLFEEREKEQQRLESEETAAWVKRFPLAELKNLGYIQNVRKVETLADGLLRFFQVANPESWDSFYGKQAVSFRKSSAFKDSDGATSIWLQLARMGAEKILTDEYDRVKFVEALKVVRRLIVESPDLFFPKMQELCSKSGVALVLVPELKDTHISGVSTWISSRKAMIAMSLRYKRNDQFWFTFFHESAHILFHGKKSTFLDVNGDDETSEQEVEANAFASNMLIPEKRYRLFVERGNFYESDIRKFAAEIAIHPGIVVGRLQHDDHIKHSWHNGLKEKYEIR